MYTIQSVDDFIDFARGDLMHQCKPGNAEALWLRPENMDIGGGRMTLREIDQLDDFPDTRVLCVSGLDQECFDYLIGKYGQQFRVLHFFKNKRVEDWSALAALSELEYMYFFHNQRIKRFWNMSTNTSLKGLVIKDFSRLQTLEGVQTAENLEYFLLGNAVWDKSQVDSYRYFAGTNVRYLGFSGSKILDNDLSYLATMPRLEVFDGLMRGSSIEQAAWVKANAANDLDIGPVIYTWEQLNGEAVTDVWFPWKQRRYRLSGNEARYERDVKRFHKLVEFYRGIPYEQAFPQQEEAR